MDIKGMDEIPVFSWNTTTQEFYVLGHKFAGVNSIEDFISYIHNLDKENKQLENNWNELKEWLLCMLEVSHLDIKCLQSVLSKMQEIESGKE